MICPNCGQPLPDTAKMCFSCRTKFDGSGSLPDVAQNNNSYNSDIVLYILNALNLAFLLMVIIGYIVPFYEVSASFSSYTEAIKDIKDSYLDWIPVVLVGIFSIPGVYYQKVTSILKLIFAFIGTGLIGILAWYLDTTAKEQMAGSAYENSIKFQLSTGFYLSLIGFILIIITAFLLFPLVYSKEQ